MLRLELAHPRVTVLQRRPRRGRRWARSLRTLALKGSSMPLDSIPAYSGFRGGHVGPAYNEAAFRHFLAVDRRRAGRSARSVLLILVAVQESLGTSVKLTDAAASALFSALAASVREVDFVGWYREGYVAAAVLAQGVRASGELPNVITKRVSPLAEDPAFYRSITEFARARRPTGRPDSQADSPVTLLPHGSLSPQGSRLPAATLAIPRVSPKHAKVVRTGSF